MSFISDFDLTAPISPLQAASRFNSHFDTYGLSLNQQADPQQRTITLIARSPASPPAQALAMNLDRFQPLSIEVNILFAQIAPAEALNFMLQALNGACSDSPETLIRWAKNRALLDAHERLTLGRTLCWTGDSMRRSEDSRSAIDRVDDATPSVLAEADASFAALWRASKPLPRMLYSRGGSLNVERGAPAPSPVVSNMTAEPNIVRLDEYVRSRRH
jgi:hypothetical protein